MTSRPLLPLLACAWVCAASRPSLADEPPPTAPMQFVCDGLHHTQTVVDGYQRDWEAEAQPAERVAQLVTGEYRYDWTGPNDASFKLWCRYTENGLYFAVVGRDDAIVPPEHDDGDVFEVLLQVEAPSGPRTIGVRVPLWNVEEGPAHPVWAPGSAQEGEVYGARGEIAPRENGYFLEFSLPYIASDALSEPFAPIPFVAAHRDIDHDAERERLAVVGSAPYERDDPSTWGTLRFTGPDALIGRVARERGLQPSDVRARLVADVGATAAREVVFVLDGHLFAAGTGLGDFAWTSVLVEPTEDYRTLGLEVHDIDGDGDGELFHRVRRERWSIDLDGTIVQEILTVYDMRQESLVPVLSQEVANELADGSRFEMAMELRERSDRTVIRFRRPTDATLAQEAWIDIDADDLAGVTAALTPWSARDRIDWDRRADGTWVVLPAAP